MLTSVRNKYGNTSQHLATALALINSDTVQKLIFYASPTTETLDYDGDSDGNVSNLPLLALLAEVAIPGVHTFYIVCDGLFLTAARRPRYLEVQELLDAACQSGKAYFSTARAPFTSSLSANEAARTLLDLTSLEPLTTTSRARYFSLLCTIPEAEYP